MAATTSTSRRSVRIAKRATRAPPTEDGADADDEYWEKRKERARVSRNRKPKSRREGVPMRPFPELDALVRRGERDSMTPEERTYYDWCRAPSPPYNDDVDAADYLEIPHEMRQPSSILRSRYEPVSVDYSDPVTGFLDGFRSAALSRLTREPQRRGLSADDLEKYAPMKSAGFPCGKACAVCLEDPAHGSSVRELPCSHVYHRACIDRWFDLSNCCPTCRKPVRPDDHTPIIPTRDQIRPDLDSWGAYVRLVSRINAPLTTA